jgi:hypothetical protein
MKSNDGKANRRNAMTKRLPDEEAVFIELPDLERGWIDSFCKTYGLTPEQYERESARARKQLEVQWERIDELRRRYRAQKAILQSIGEELNRAQRLPGEEAPKEESLRWSGSYRVSGAGIPDGLCHAITRRGKRCTRRPWRNTLYCYLHGGYSPRSGDVRIRDSCRRLMALHEIILANLRGIASASAPTGTVLDNDTGAVRRIESLPAVGEGEIQ